MRHRGIAGPAWQRLWRSLGAWRRKVRREAGDGLQLHHCPLLFRPLRRSCIRRSRIVRRRTLYALAEPQFQGPIGPGDVLRRGRIRQWVSCLPTENVRLGLVILFWVLLPKQSKPIGRAYMAAIQRPHKPKLHPNIVNRGNASALADHILFCRTRFPNDCTVGLQRGSNRGTPLPAGPRIPLAKLAQPNLAIEFDYTACVPCRPSLACRRCVSLKPREDNLIDIVDCDQAPALRVKLLKTADIVSYVFSGRACWTDPVIAHQWAISSCRPKYLVGRIISRQVGLKCDTSTYTNFGRLSRE